MTSTDKENVFRTLKEEPLLANHWCKFGWHRWERYGELSSAGPGLAGDHYKQSRRCSSCYRVQIRRITVRYK